MKTLSNINCYNLKSPRTGRAVANQFAIYIATKKGCKRVFKSYETFVAMVDESGCVTLDKSYRKSATTEKYLNQFLGNTKPERKKLIEQNVYKLADLN